MKLLKESEYSEIKSKHIVVMTCRVDYLTLNDVPGADAINPFLKQISDNVQEYAKGRLAEREIKLYEADTSRKKRLYEMAVPFVFSMRGETVADSYINVEMTVEYREKRSKKYVVLSLEDGKIEGIESFCKRRAVKKYLKDDFKVTNTQISIFHKGKSIKLSRDYGTNDL